MCGGFRCLVLSSALHTPTLASAIMILSRNTQNSTQQQAATSSTQSTPKQQSKALSDRILIFHRFSTFSRPGFFELHPLDGYTLWKTCMSCPFVIASSIGQCSGLTIKLTWRWTGITCA